MFWRLADALTEAGLGVRELDWVGTHPRIASVYLSALADRIARRNRLSGCAGS